MRSKYDTIIIGSGLGGLMTALILAKEGKKVAVLEQNKQFGGMFGDILHGRKVIICKAQRPQ